MADDSDTPAPPPSAAKPATPRRRAPRASSAKATGTSPKTRAAASKPAKPKPATATATAAKRTKADDQSTLEKATAATAKRTRAARKTVSKAAKTADRATDKVGGRWGAAAIAGGVAAVGAAAALFTLRGSTPKPKPGTLSKPGAGAHQPDGSDASKSFAAGIADENTIPDA